MEPGADPHEGDPPLVTAVRGVLTEMAMTTARAATAVRALETIAEARCVEECGCRVLARKALRAVAR